MGVGSGGWGGGEFAFFFLFRFLFFLGVDLDGWISKSGSSETLSFSGEEGGVEGGATITCLYVSGILTIKVKSKVLGFLVSTVTL